VADRVQHILNRCNGILENGAVADARSRVVRRRVAKQVAGLNPDREREALQRIETVSEFDADATR